MLCHHIAVILRRLVRAVVRLRFEVAGGARDWPCAGLATLPHRCERARNSIRRPPRGSDPNRDAPHRRARVAAEALGHISG